MVARRLAVVLMIIVQVIYTVMNMFYQVVLSDGMNLRVLIAYRWIFASMITVPVAWIVERNRRQHHQLTWTILGLAFLSGFLGGTSSQNLYVESVTLTSATYAAAITNLSPAFTLVLAAALRLENLRLGTLTGKMKLAGVVIGIAGAMLITFFTGGVEVKLWSIHVHLLKGRRSPANHISVVHYILGFVTASTSCFFYSLWLMVQTKLSASYPLPCTNAALTAVMAALQCTIFSLCLERNWSDWRLGWDVRLPAVLYAGIVNSGVVLVCVAWCVSVRGPIFVSSFSPLSLVLIGFFAALFLQEHLHLGWLIGSAVIVISLYMVLWAQGRELKQRAALEQHDQTTRALESQ